MNKMWTYLPSGVGCILAVLMNDNDFAVVVPARNSYQGGMMEQR